MDMYVYDIYIYIYIDTYILITEATSMQHMRTLPAAQVFSARSSEAWDSF